MIIDCHGHFTKEPTELHEYRAALIKHAEGHGKRPERFPGVDSQALKTIIAENQLRLQQERGTDLTILSPRASGMGHHVPGEDIALEWAQVSNEMIADICELYPKNFVGACQLPQTVNGDLTPVVEELERRLEQGFVGANLNPDPSGGHWTSPPLSDTYWDPIWGALEAAGAPAMVHVSGSCAPGVHTTGAHYIAGDTIAFMQLLQGNVFERFPDLKLIIPHGGGAAPYHWGRYRGLAMRLEKPELSEHLMNNVFFDTCVYHQAGIDLLFEVIGHQNILFGSELLGAINEIDPVTRHSFDDTKRYIDNLPLTDEQRYAVFEGNARRVYPRLDAHLKSKYVATTAQ